MVAEVVDVDAQDDGGAFGNLADSQSDGAHGAVDFVFPLRVVHLWEKLAPHEPKDAIGLKNGIVGAERVLKYALNVPVILFQVAAL